jgi:hypothetical protein
MMGVSLGFVVLKSEFSMPRKVFWALIRVQRLSRTCAWRGLGGSGRALPDGQCLT